MRPRTRGGARLPWEGLWPGPQPQPQSPSHPPFPRGITQGQGGPRAQGSPGRNPRGATRASGVFYPWGSRLLCSAPQLDAALSRAWFVRSGAQHNDAPGCCLSLLSLRPLIFPEDSPAIRSWSWDIH